MSSCDTRIYIKYKFNKNCNNNPKYTINQFGEWDHNIYILILNGDSNSSYLIHG